MEKLIPISFIWKNSLLKIKLDIFNMEKCIPISFIWKIYPVTLE